MKNSPVSPKAMELVTDFYTHLLSLQEKKNLAWVEKMAQEFYTTPQSLLWWLQWSYSSLPLEKDLSLALPLTGPDFSFWEKKSICLILASNSFAHMFQAFLFAILGRFHKIYIKPPVNCESFVQFLLLSTPKSYKNKAIELLDPKAPKDSFQEIFQGVDFILLYGSQKTIDLFAQGSLHPKCSYQGPKNSLVIIDAFDAWEKNWELLAYDLFLFDLKGCMGPHVIYIHRSLEKTVRKKMKKFVSFLEKFALAHGPRGPLFSGEFDQIYRQCAIYDFLGHCERNSQFNLSLLSNDTWPEIFLPRFIHLRIFDNYSQIQSILKTHKIINVGHTKRNHRPEFLRLKGMEFKSPLSQMQGVSPFSFLRQLFLSLYKGPYPA